MEARRRRNQISTSLPLLLLLPFSTFLVVFIFVTAAESSSSDADRITNLPGQPPVTFKQFSGYVTVDEHHGRALFYWLTEATSDAATKPLVLWLNGGPGCSSVAYGASEEIGPFRINRTGHRLFLNKYSWNREANLLFLESPVGVGFSYTNTSSDLKSSGDFRTADDSLMFLIRWMEKFPQYKYRDFYISGESYAGHYVPQLAKKIHDHNKNLENPKIKLKGFIVGNAVTDNYYDNLGTVTYWWTHSMISDETYHNILAQCNFSNTNVTHNCEKSMSYAMNHEFGDIDQYSIYTPACLKSKSSNATHKLRFKGTLLRRRGYDPCTESYAEKYYNRVDVQKAIHANTTGIKRKWTACSDYIIKNWGDTALSMLPLYKELMNSSMRIWMFSGDTDSVVPVTATRFAISHLNLPINVSWYPWYVGRQVAGWTEVYRDMIFASIRGAGHEVPLFQPRRAFHLFKSFLAGEHLPSNPKS